VVYGEPDPTREIEYVTAVQTVCANGNLGRGMELGVNGQTPLEVPSNNTEPMTLNKMAAWTGQSSGPVALHAQTRPESHDSRGRDSMTHV
jgi:hypothetical protein